LKRFFKVRIEKSQRKRNPAAAYLLLFFVSLVSWLTIAGFSQSRPRPLYWEIKINLILRGSYLFSDKDRNVEGVFRGHFLWQGLLEPDEPDIILYHWQTETLSWEISEKEKREGKETNIPCSLKPRFKVNAFLREGEVFWLDLLLEKEASTFSPSEFEPHLVLPASYLQNLVFNGLRYNDYLQAGSNKISIPVKEMSRPEYRQSFSWKWSYPRSYPRLNLNELGEEHEVKIDLHLKAHFEKKLSLRPGDGNGHKFPGATCGSDGCKSGW